MAYVKLLKNVPLDNEYKNPILFTGNSVTLPSNFSKVTYNSFFSTFDSEWKPSATNGLHMNIKIGNGINTTIVVPEESYQPSYNYCVVTYGNDEIKPCSYSHTLSKVMSGYYFYFITNAVPLGRGNYALTLELDVMTTYFPYLSLEHKIFVERKHCNRWKSNGLMEWKDAILGDEIDNNFYAKYISKIIKPSYKVINESSVYGISYERVNTELQNAWVYLFFTEQPLTTSQSTRFLKVFNGDLAVNTQLICIAVPLKTVNIQLWLNGTLKTSMEYGVRTSSFIQLTQDSKCVGAKLSFRSPFNYDITYPHTDIKNCITISDDNEISYHVTCTDGITDIYGDFGNFTFYGNYNGETTIQAVAINVNNLPSSIITSDDINIHDECYIPTGSDYESDYINVYKKNYYINAEPKMFCKPFFSLTLTSQFGGTYDFNPLLLNQDTTNIKIYSEISVEPDKIYYTITTEDTLSPYYNFKNCNIGVITVNDNNIPYRQDAYATYLANHRASYVTSLAVPLVAGTTNTLSTVASMQLSEKGGSNIGGIFGGLIGMGTSAINWASNIVDLKNTPDAIKNLGNNPVHDFIMDNTMYPYIIMYTLFENERKQVYDYFYDNGYKVNRKLFYTNDYTDTTGLITRQKFNYVKLRDNITNEISITSGSLQVYVPQIVKQKINSILNAGTKLWTLIYLTQDNATWQDFYLGNEFENAEICIPS